MREQFGGDLRVRQFPVVKQKVLARWHNVSGNLRDIILLDRAGRCHTPQAVSSEWQYQVASSIP